MRVEDPSDATIPGAQVIVLSGSEVPGEFTADGTGLALVRRRAIRLIVSAHGFATTEQEVSIPLRPPPQITVARSIGVMGVLSSPLFGQPTSAQAARRMELGWPSRSSAEDLAARPAALHPDQ